MRAVDTNVLVYAEISASPRHEQAKQVLEELAEGEHPWALPWPCVYEFLRVVTHPGIYHPPVPLKVALEDVEAIMSSPSLMMLGETARHAAVMERVVRASGATGSRTEFLYRTRRILFVFRNSNTAPARKCLTRKKKALPSCAARGR